MDNDTLDFIAYSTIQPSICTSGLFRALVNRYTSIGYTLTRGIPYPISAPTNILYTETEIDAAIRHACDFSRRRRILNLWRASFSFALHLAQPTPDVITWTLFVWRDIFFHADPDRTEQHAREVLNAVTIAVEMLPTHYGCLATLHYPPTVEQVLNGNISRLYPINYFGDQLLAQIGRARLEQAPAWLNVDVGLGRLIVPDLNAIYQGDTTTVQAANRYLFGDTLPLTTDGNGEIN